ENEIKQMIQSYFNRGRVEVFITLSGEYLTNKNLSVDWDLMDQYFNKLEAIKQRYSLTETIQIEMVTQLQDLFIVHETNDNLTSLEKKNVQGLKRACKQVISSRANDRAFLIAEIEKRIYETNNMLKKLEALQTTARSDYYK